jgi:hypothetical protein
MEEAVLANDTESVQHLAANIAASGMDIYA